MAKIDEHQYRIQVLERQMAGVQRQQAIQNARYEQTAKKQDQRLRNIEIKLAVTQGLPQVKVAEIFQLSPGRVNQILKKVA